MGNKKKNIIICSIILAFAVIYPFIVPNDYFIHLVGLAMIYSIFALGANIMIGYIGELALCFGSFFAIGAYSVAILDRSSGVSFIWTLLSGGIISVIFALLLGYIVFRLKGPYFALITLAFGELLLVLARNWVELTEGVNGISGINYPKLFGLTFDSDFKLFYFILFFLLLTVLLILAIMNSSYGRAMLAIKDNEKLAVVAGINPFKYKQIAFGLTAFICALAGGLFAYFQLYINSDVAGIFFTIDVIAMVIIGGAGSIPGVILGAMFVTLVPEVIGFPVEYRVLTYSVIALLIVIFMPKGLWPTLSSVIFFGKKGFRDYNTGREEKSG